MPVRLNPSTVRAVPDRFQAIYAHAVEVRSPEKILFVSGQIGVSPDGETLKSFGEQCQQAMSNVEAILKASDMSVADILRVTYYVTRASDLPALGEARRSRWASAKPPAVTTLVVAGLATPDLLVEIEVMAGF